MPWTKKVYRDRCFLISEYYPDSAGIFKPAKPSVCSAAHGGVAGSCEIRIHAYRVRKCGPGFNLAVFLCRTHGLTFTIYPPGWIPFSRRILVGDGSTQDAVHDLAAGKNWPEHSNPSFPTGRTQRRWIIAWSTLIGLEQSVGDIDHLKASTCLGIPTMILKEATNKIRAGPTMKGRAQCIQLMTFTYKPLESSLFQRGYQVGYWGTRHRYTALIGRNS